MCALQTRGEGGGFECTKSSRDGGKNTRKGYDKGRGVELGGSGHEGGRENMGNAEGAEYTLKKHVFTIAIR